MIRFVTDVDFARALATRDEFLVPLARVHHLLPGRGIEFSATDGDFVFADSDSGPVATDRPIVMLDRADGAFLWWRFLPQGDVARRWVNSDDLAGLIKISRYRDLDGYNATLTDESLHTRLIWQSGGLDPPLGRQNAVPPLSAAPFAKLRLGAGYWAFDQCAPLAEQPIDASQARPIDVFCAVSVDYDCPVISWHRAQAVRELGALKHLRIVLGRGRLLSEETYRELIRQSRICVSPWGWGETCHRDYEALLAGCTLIKPRTEFIDTLLPLDERHYVPCEPDFSDLAERVESALADWPHSADRREANRRYVLAARNPELLADQWAAALRGTIEGS
jgi:hypothetical protein